MIVTVPAAHMGSMSRNHKIVIIAVAVVTIVLIIIGIASCAAKDEPASGAAPVSGGYSSAAYAGCVPPMACGPHYAGYIPPYYAAHPSFVLLTPYSSYYAPSFNGKAYTTVRTPAGRAPVTSRTAMPYPPGYKPVPGDFRPPTAPAKAPPVPATQPSVAVPAPKPSVKAPAPAVKAPAPVRKAPSAPRPAPRSKSGGR